MHIDIHLGRRPIMLLAGAVVLLAIAGAAYATIPDSNGVFTACRLNALDTIRLIDPSAPSSSLLSHCTSLETQISWNEKGQKGDTGAPGLPGTNGVNGVSPTVTPLSAGDSHCPAGGAAITGAAGSTAYVCSGQPFAGTFTSPNGQFSLSVTDGGVQVTGPDAKVSLPSSGGVTVMSSGNVSVTGDHIETIANNETITVHGDRTERVDNNETLKVGNDENVTVQGNRTEKVSSDENLTVQGNRTETVGGSLGLLVSGAMNFTGTLVGINNAGTACRPVARVADQIDPNTDLILTGSPTVCIG